MGRGKQGATRSWAPAWPYLAFAAFASLIVVVSFIKSRDRPAAVFHGEPVAADTSPAPFAPVASSAMSRPAPMVTAADEEAQQQKIEAEIGQRAESQHKAYAQRFAQENIEAAWASGKEAKMLGASRSDQIAALKAKPAHLDIDCRSSMCRIQADFAGRSAAEDWMTLFSLGVGGEMPQTTFEYAQAPGGGTQLIMYSLAK